MSLVWIIILLLWRIIIKTVITIIILLEKAIACFIKIRWQEEEPAFETNLSNGVLSYAPLGERWFLNT